MGYGVMGLWGYGLWVRGESLQFIVHSLQFIGERGEFIVHSL